MINRSSSARPPYTQGSSLLARRWGFVLPSYLGA
jgi:hypothetical protein